MQSTMTNSKRYQILDCSIDRAGMDQAMTKIEEKVQSSEGGYVCFANVHTVISAREDLRLRQINNESLMSLADGKPLTLLAKHYGIEDAERVAGPDFMLRMLTQYRHLRHYFYGSTEQTLTALVRELTGQFPDLNVAGALAPPFRELTDDEGRAITAAIQQTRPDLIWVGLGAPKQEYWMAANWQQLKPAVLLGVGAAFDFHAGTKPRAPDWMQKCGLEWLHRLYSEPGRLWKRYIITNGKFIYYALTRKLFRRQ